MRKLPQDGDQDVSAIRAWKAEIHKRDVRPMTAKFRNGLDAIDRLADQHHIRFSRDDRCEALSKDRMVLDAQDANRFDLSHFGLSGIGEYSSGDRSRSRDADRMSGAAIITRSVGSGEWGGVGGRGFAVRSQVAAPARRGSFQSGRGKWQV